MHAWQQEEKTRGLYMSRMPPVTTYSIFEVVTIPQEAPPITPVTPNTAFLGAYNGRLLCYPPLCTYLTSIPLSLSLSLSLSLFLFCLCQVTSYSTAQGGGCRTTSFLMSCCTVSLSSQLPTPISRFPAPRIVAYGKALSIDARGASHVFHPSYLPSSFLLLLAENCCGTTLYVRFLLPYVCTPILLQIHAPPAYR